MDMTKFNDLEDAGFVAITGELRRWCKEVPSPSAENAPFPSLLVAAASPNIIALEYELRTALDINVIESTPTRRNALHIATAADQPENISLLLRAGVNVHAKAEKEVTPLQLASMLGRVEVVKVIIEQGNVDPNERNSNQITPLHIAALNGQLQVVKVLLEHGADPRATDNSGWTPLTVAIAGKHEEMIQALVTAMDSSNEIMQ